MGADAFHGLEEVVIRSTLELMDDPEVRADDAYRVEQLKRPMAVMIVVLERLLESGTPALSRGPHVARALQQLRHAREVAYHVTAGVSGIFQPRDRDYPRDRATELDRLRGDLLELLRAYAETLDPPSPVTCLTCSTCARPSGA